MLASLRARDWVADVIDGTVDLAGPDDSPDRAVAHLVAGTVPGVVEVNRD